MSQYVSEYEKSKGKSDEVEKEFYAILKEIELNTDFPYEKNTKIKKTFYQLWRS